MTVRIEHGDMREVLGRMVAEGLTVQSIVCDPPYHLQSIHKRFAKVGRDDKTWSSSGPHQRTARGFMNQKWDGGDVAFRSGTWRLCYDLLPPGGHLLAFSGTRTFHRMATAIEEAGFEIRDTIAWLYGSGFPKSHNVSKGIDKAAGAEREATGWYQRPDGQPRNMDQWAGRKDSVAAHDWTPQQNTAPATDAARQWEGWGTALKPAMELICLARKPLESTVAANVLQHGTGAINIDGCRVEGEPWQAHIATGLGSVKFFTEGEKREIEKAPHAAGRWPANVCHDGSDEVVSAFPETVSGGGPEEGTPRTRQNVYGEPTISLSSSLGSNTGSAARFFYSSKADAGDRLARDTEEVEISWISEAGPCQVKLRADTGQSPERAIVASGSGTNKEWNTFLCGSGISDLCRRASNCTTKTGTSSTTASGTWRPLLRSITSASIAAAPSEKGNGGSPAGSAEPNILSATIIAGQTESLPGASRALSGTPLKISVSAKRQGTLHPTVKPVDLMRWLVRLITPPGGTCLDPFAGSGTTGMACMAEGFDCIMVEAEAEYVADIRRRIAHVSGDDTPLFSTPTEAA